MEIKKELNCPANYVYDQIIHSVIYDIKKHTGNHLKEDQLKDFSYVKQFDNGSTGTITILDAIPNKHYIFETKKNHNTIISGYQFTALDEYHCCIEFKEERYSEHLLQKINNFLMMIFFDRGKKSNFLNMLEQMEETYQDERIKLDIDHLKNN